MRGRTLVSGKAPVGSRVLGNPGSAAAGEGLCGGAVNRVVAPEKGRSLGDFSPKVLHPFRLSPVCPIPAWKDKSLLFPFSGFS